jgi:Zn-dependent protease
MPLITVTEIIYMIIVTIVLGYIFTSYIPVTPKKILLYKKRFDWQQLKFASLVAAPGIILHELAHKFLAMGFGHQAIFQVFYPGLILAVFLKLISSPLLIIAPGYVVIQGITNSLESRLIAFAGPFINLSLWLLASLLLKKKRLSRKQVLALFLTKRINMILFIFNMIPIPPLDGYTVFFG